MFDINNKEWIMNIVLRKGNKIVIPLYVNIDNTQYNILELTEDRIHNVTRNGFKVGFGCIDSMLAKTTIFFDRDLLQYFSNVNTFNYFDEYTNLTSFYYVFECDSDTAKMLIDEFGNRQILDEIILYDERLFEYVSKLVSDYRSKCIEKFNNEINE